MANCVIYFSVFVLGGFDLSAFLFMQLLTHVHDSYLIIDGQALGSVRKWHVAIIACMLILSLIDSLFEYILSGNVLSQSTICCVVIRCRRNVAC